MGYLCPVCGDPQADGTHLANHLAVTALVHGREHEAFLEERVPGWAEMGAAELSEHVTGEAEQAEFPQVFEDTTHDHDEHGHGHDHDGEPREHGHNRPDIDPQVDVGATGEMDEETAAIIERARELTRQRRANAENERGSDGESDGENERGSDGESDGENERDSDDS
jgi:hypothetical protein